MAMREGLLAVYRHLSRQPGFSAQHQAARLIGSSAVLARYRQPMATPQVDGERKRTYAMELWEYACESQELNLRCIM